MTKNTKVYQMNHDGGYHSIAKIKKNPQYFNKQFGLYLVNNGKQERGSYISEKLG